MPLGRMLADPRDPRPERTADAVKARKPNQRKASLALPSAQRLLALMLSSWYIVSKLIHACVFFRPRSTHIDLAAEIPRQLDRQCHRAAEVEEGVQRIERDREDGVDGERVLDRGRDEVEER